MTATPSRTARPAALMTAAGALALLGVLCGTIVAWALHATREALLAVPAEIGFLP